jgi:hypothetical protein
MTPVRTAYAWVGARLTLMNERDGKERGEGPVSYIAVVLMIAAVVAILIGTEIPDKIKTLIVNAINTVGTKGKISG